MYSTTRADKTMTNIDKVLAAFAGISAGDPELATRYINPERFLQHNPHAADGVEGLKQFISHASRETLSLTVVRSFEDGPYVVTQAKGQRAGQNIFFDVFRFEDALIVEHWAYSAKEAPPNKSGHTQLDGPIEPTHLDDTEKNKSFVHDYYQTFHIAGNHSQSERYFAGEMMIRHEPDVHDGVSQFLQDVAVLMQHRTIDEIRLLLGQGDFVFVAAKGTHDGQPCVYIDLYRVEAHKIVEHWGFPEKVPSPDECRNTNGML